MRPYLDARTWSAQEKRSALVRWADQAIMFTASWMPPTELVQRRDGTFRRRYALNLFVPAEHRERPFHLVKWVTLCQTGDRPSFMTDDIEGVSSRDLAGITLTVYVDDRH